MSVNQSERVSFDLNVLTAELSGAIDAMLRFDVSSDLGLASRLAVPSIGVKLYHVLGNVDELDDVLYEICESRDDWIAAFDLTAMLWSAVIPGWDN
jgi:hypothetical protein